MKKSFKLIIVSTLISILCLMPMIGFAAPEVISTNFNGNVGYLISVRNPSSTYSYTSNKTCVISAVGLQDTVVTLYSYNPYDRLFHRMYGPSGAPLQTTIGASGLYAQQVQLKDGENLIMVYATRGPSETETVKLDINVLGQGSINKITTFSGNIYNMFN